jgi:hypothetical protein
MGSMGIYFDSFTDEDLVQIFGIKPWDVAFEKGIALGELVFEILGVTARSEGLTISVFLVTRSSGSCTGGTSWVFRVTLIEKRKVRKRIGRDIPCG